MILANTISLFFLLLLIGFIWVWRRSLVDQDRAKKLASIILRGLAFAALVVALCRPHWKQGNDNLHVIYLVDGSQSVAPASLTSASHWITESQRALRSGDTSEVLLFGRTIQKSSAEKVAEFAKQAEAGTSESGFRASTNLAESMKAVRFFFPSEKAKRLVVLSDGVETGMPIGESLRTLQDEGVEVFLHPLDSLAKAEVAVVSLEPASTFAYQGEMMRLNARVQSNVDQVVQARLLHRGVVVAEENVPLQKDQVKSFSFDTEMTTAGANLWSLEVVAGQDFFNSNNKVSTNIKVKGLPRYLVIHEKEKLMSPFVRAMKRQGISLEVRGEYGLPETLAELLAYDGVILADVSATAFSKPQMENVKRYVTDFGGGLLMLGSENSYGLGGYFKTPIEDVLPLTSRYEKEKQKPSLAMVLVIDKSGSMSGQPIAIARASAIAAAELLGPNDQIAVVGFSGDAHIICDLTPASDQTTIKNAIGSLDAGGGTNLEPAMREGRRILQEATAKVKHMIILSDGQTGGSGYQEMAQEMASEQMTVSTVALGSGAAKDLMQMIAQEGKGRYYETADAEKMPQIFTKETMKASRSSIKEDLFNSIVVGDHPMLNGYENTELPFILGYVMARPKPTAQVLLAAETGDPLFAISRYGLGFGGAYTSDLTERWGGEWLASAQGAPFWAQALRAIARKEESAGLGATLHENGDDLTVKITRRDPAGRTVEQVPWDIKLTNPTGDELPYKVKQSGLGQYDLTFSAAGHPAVDIRLHDTLASLTKTIHWRRSYPKEYNLSSDISPALSSLNNLSPQGITENIQSAHTYQNMSWVFVFLAIALFIAGLVTRRL